jgi:hypothetical protein
MQYDPAKSLFSCKACTKEQKKNRGCKRAKRKPIYNVNCICKHDKNCKICKGSGSINLRRCPSLALRDKEIYDLLPFFYAWRGSEYKVYGDGQGMYFQPIIMLDAFNLIDLVCNRIETAKAKR